MEPSDSRMNYKAVEAAMLLLERNYVSQFCYSLGKEPTSKEKGVSFDVALQNPESPNRRKGGWW